MVIEIGENLKKTITGCKDHKENFHKEIISVFNGGMFKKEEEIKRGTLKGVVQFVNLRYGYKDTAEE